MIIWSFAGDYTGKGHAKQKKRKKKLDVWFIIYVESWYVSIILHKNKFTYSSTLHSKVLEKIEYIKSKNHRIHKDFPLSCTAEQQRIKGSQKPSVLQI